MALHFISSSVLKGENDGIEAEEVTIDTDETRKQRLKAEQDAKKSLYLQLQERQALKDEEFEENRRKIFAPPPGLDEDDVEYFNDLTVAKEQMLTARHLEEERALEEFRLAAHDRVSSSSMTSAAAQTSSAATSSGSGVVLSIPAKTDKPSDIQAHVKIVKKRRLNNNSNGDPVAAVAAAPAPAPPAPAPPAPSSALQGLASYGSDDEDD